MVLRLLVAEVVASFSQLATTRDKIKLGADGLAHHSSSVTASFRSCLQQVWSSALRLRWPQVSRWDGLSAGLIKPSGLWGRLVASTWTVPQQLAPACLRACII